MVQNIAIFGGSFNPIHLGHLHLCRTCQAVCSLERVILMPSNLPPHKIPADLPPAEHRLAMCHLAIQGEPTLSVSDLELKRAGISYTLTTLQELRNRHPEATITLIIGSDMLYTFHQWYGYEEILQHHPVVTAARIPGEYHRMTDYRDRLGPRGSNITIVQEEVVPVSSTQVRKALLHGESTEGLLHPAVRAYIDAHGLYGQ